MIGLTSRHRQQLPNVVHHALHARPDRCKPRQSQQIQRRRSETSHDACAISLVAMGIFMQLGVADPVPTLNAPPVSRQSQQGFWACAEAGEKEVFGVEGLAVAGSCGGNLNNPACAEPGLTDVLRCLFRSQRPGDVPAMTDLLIHCNKRDLAYPLELMLNLAMQRALIGFNGQEEVGSLLLELLKNGFWVCRASAWMSSPWRSNSPRSFLSTARSWFSPVA